MSGQATKPKPPPRLNALRRQGPHRSEVRQPSSIIPLIPHTRPIPKMKAPSSSPAAKRAVKATARIQAVSSARQRTALFPSLVYRKGSCQTKPWATAAEKVCTGRLKHLRQSPPPLPPLPLRRLRAAAPKPPPCLPIADRRTARPLPPRRKKSRRTHGMRANAHGGLKEWTARGGGLWNG